MKCTKACCIISFCIVSILLTGCHKEDVGTVDSGNVLPSMKTNNPNSYIVLGNPIKDPYKYSNMVDAAMAISQGLPEIVPTGKYVKVLVREQEEWDALMEDTTIVWFDYPLEYEIADTGCYYYDSSIPDSTFWLYGVVPPNDSILLKDNCVPIYDVFIPQDCPYYNLYEQKYELLEKKSYELCGYIDEVIEFEELKPKSTSDYWRPSATISVWDDVSCSDIPLQGVRVKANRGTYTARMVTDANGMCSAAKRFRYRVNYSLDWYRKNWRIVIGNNNKSTFITGPFSRSRWNLEISNGPDLARATIHRAALLAKFSSLWTIHSPYGCSAKKIRYNHSSNFGVVGSSNCKPGGINFHGADIIIWGYDGYDNPFETDDILAGTIHELTHWSHRRYLGSSSFSLVQPCISESWAFCVEWYIMTHLYPNSFGPHGYKDGHQTWLANVPNHFGNYTPVFVDLMDSYNQRQTSSDYCNDNISGYTLAEIQGRFIHAFTFTALRTELLKSNNLLHGATADDVDNLMVIYYDVIN